MRNLIVAAAAVLALGTALPATAQPNAARDRARIQVRLGEEDMRVEKWAEAARNFQQAIDIDPSFEYAYYDLGRADMALKKYVDAIAAYTKSRALYEAQAGKQFSNAQDAQRARREEITEIDDRIRSLQGLPQTVQTQDQLRQLQDYKRRRLEDISRGNNITIEDSVPAWVSVALGSALFRAGHMQDAEREYKAAIEADAKTGEAHSNLAVVYLQTGRIEEAEKSVKAAEKAGFKVNPMLKEDIAARKKAGSN